MIDDFVVRALVAAVGVALVAGPLGCFIVWRRMAYFGDSLAHSALLGVALGLVLGIAPSLGILVAALALGLGLAALERRRGLARDTLLGIMAHTGLALGLVVLALFEGVRIDLFAYLFGDVLAVGPRDLAVIWGGGAAVLAVLAAIWRPLLAATVAEDMARAEGLAVDRARLAFVVLLAAVIAIAMKIVGILLITSLLIIPAATARRLARGPEAMAGIAAGVGAIAAAGGVAGSLAWDTPTGPSIVVAAALLFVLGLVATSQSGQRR